MIRFLFVILSFVSVILFPWQITAVLILCFSISVPLLPLAAGIFADVLYYSSHTTLLPLFTIFGAAASGAAFFVRGKFRANINR